MEFQSEQIKKELTKHGWQITASEVFTSDWWLDELWTIESLWSKVGTKAFVCYLVDPMIADANRKKGEHVWAVRASRDQPGDRLSSSDECVLVLNKRWKQQLPTLIAYLDKTRH